MCLTNKQIDRAVEMAEADTAYALAHSSDNGAAYVANRYADLHGAYCQPVPVRAGAAILPSGRLFPASRRSQRDGAYDVPSASPRQGIVATLMDEASGELADYHVETDGRNGVEVTGLA